MSLSAIAAVTIGMHIHSLHIPERDYQNNVNPGLYIRVNDWQVGAYHNTNERTSAYIGKAYHFGEIDVMPALMYGYQKRKVGKEVSGFSRGAITPVLAISYALPKVGGLTPRLTVMPPAPKHSTVLHLSVEY